MFHNFYLITLAVLGFVILSRMVYSYRYWIGWQYNTFSGRFKRVTLKQKSDRDYYT